MKKTWKVKFAKNAQWRCDQLPSELRAPIICARDSKVTQRRSVGVWCVGLRILYEATHISHGSIVSCLDIILAGEPVAQTTTNFPQVNIKLAPVPGSASYLSTAATMRRSLHVVCVVRPAMAEIGPGERKHAA